MTQDRGFGLGLGSDRKGDEMGLDSEDTLN